MMSRCEQEPHLRTCAANPLAMQHETVRLSLSSDGMGMTWSAASADVSVYSGELEGSLCRHARR